MYGWLFSSLNQNGQDSTHESNVVLLPRPLRLMIGDMAQIPAKWWTRRKAPNYQMVVVQKQLKPTTPSTQYTKSMKKYCQVAHLAPFANLLPLTGVLLWHHPPPRSSKLTTTGFELRRQKTGTNIQALTKLTFLIYRFLFYLDPLHPFAALRSSGTYTAGYPTSSSAAESSIIKLSLSFTTLHENYYQHLFPSPHHGHSYFQEGSEVLYSFFFKEWNIFRFFDSRPCFHTWNLNSNSLIHLWKPWSLAYKS